MLKEKENAVLAGIMQFKLSRIIFHFLSQSSTNSYPKACVVIDCVLKKRSQGPDRLGGVLTTHIAEEKLGKLHSSSARQ